MLEIVTITSSSLQQFFCASAYETVIVLPAIDRELAAKASQIMQRRTRQEGLLLVVEDDMRLGFITVANRVYAQTTSRYFAYVAQDAYPGKFWLDYGLDTLKKSQAGLLAFSDGRFFGKLATFGLADRHWLSTTYGNALFYSGYTRHFGDTNSLLSPCQ